MIAEDEEPYKCPKCNSTNNEIVATEVDGMGFWEYWECNECEFKWDVFYRLEFDHWVEAR